MEFILSYDNSVINQAASDMSNDSLKIKSLWFIYFFFNYKLTPQIITSGVLIYVYLSNF